MEAKTHKIIYYSMCPTCIPLYPAPPNKSGTCFNLVSVAAFTLLLFRLHSNFFVGVFSSISK